MVFPTGWAYFKEYDQPGTADGEQTNYQVEITVTYVSGKMRSDFGDVRFTDDDRTELYYHLVSYTASTTALFVVKIPTLPTDGMMVRCYYGNASATTTSDPDNVYPLYDDFNDNNINTSLWTTNTPVGTITESGGKLNISIGSGQDGSWWSGSVEYAPIIYSPKPSGSFEYIVKITSLSYSTQSMEAGLILYKNRDNVYQFSARNDGSQKIEIDKIVGNRGSVVTSTGNSTIPLWLKIRYDGTTYYFDYSTDNENWTNLYSTSSLGFIPDYMGLQAAKWNTSTSMNVSFDDFIVRKHTINPPASGTWGEENISILTAIAEFTGLSLVWYDLPTAMSTFTTLSPSITNWEFQETAKANFTGLALKKWFAYTPSFFIENEDGIILNELSFESLFPGAKSQIQRLTAVNNLDSEMNMTLTPGESFNQLGDGIDTYLSHYLSSDGVNFSNNPLLLSIPAMSELDFYTYWHPTSMGKMGAKQWLCDLDLEGVPSLEGWGYVSWFTVTGTGVAIEIPYTLDEPVRIDYVHGLMESDFKDIRFALADHTVLEYDLLSKVDGDHAYFAVQLPEIPASPNEVTVYVYSGNPGAENESDPTIHQLHNTFQGTSLNPDTWEINAVGNIVYEINNYLRITNCHSNFSTSWITGLATDTGNQHQQKVWKIKSNFNIEWRSTLSTAGLDRGQGGLGLIRDDNSLIIFGGHEDIDYPTAVRWLSFYNTEGVWTNVASGWTGEGTNKITKQENGTKIFNIERNGNTISAYVEGTLVGTTTISSTIDRVAVVAGRVQGGFSSFVPYIQLDYLCEEEFVSLSLPIPVVGEVDPQWINIYPLPVRADILYKSVDLPELDVERRYGVRIGGTLFE